MPIKHSFTIAAASLLVVAATAGLAETQPRAADANQDGTLTRAEADAGADRLFVRLDADHDGRLTPADRTAARTAHRAEAFARADADHDGAISRAEWTADGVAMDARRAERRAQLAAARGAADDGARHTGGRHRRGGMMALAARADSNGDHAVDRAEFMAAAAQRFARQDANHDGNVSAAERAAGHARRGGEWHRGRSAADDGADVGAMPPPA